MVTNQDSKCPKCNRLRTGPFSLSTPFCNCDVVFQTYNVSLMANQSAGMITDQDSKKENQMNDELHELVADLMELIMQATIRFPSFLSDDESQEKLLKHKELIEKILGATK